MQTTSKYRQEFLDRLVIGICLSLFVGCSEFRSDDVSQTGDPVRTDAAQPNDLPSGDLPEPYKGKSVQEWIGQLREASDAKSRAQAAEALGFQARSGRMTYGGFSDIPIDSPEPPKLHEDVLRSIVSALIGGLKDRHERVRTSSAVALSWIGPRAKTATTPLIRLLSDSNKEARQAALKAIGRIGPDAKAAISTLKWKLAWSQGQDSVDIAEALRLVEAPPDTYVPALIRVLAEDGPAHYAAMELGQLGDPAVPALLKALRDGDVHRRQYAAYTLASMAGWNKLTKDREVVAQALVRLSQEKDAGVAYKAAQALGSVHAAPEQSVPALIALLNHSDEDVVSTAADALGEFEAQAQMALPALLRLLTDPKSEKLSSIDYAIRRIGVDRASADELRKMSLKEEGTWLLIPLFEYPEAAVDFLRRNPHVVDVPKRDCEALVAMMRNSDRRFQDLQTLLYQNESLPLAIMAELGEPRFLPLLERKRENASKHEQTKIEACARACGKPADRIVEVAAGNAGDFKPKSAWPETDPARSLPRAIRDGNSITVGHGDGFTEVIVTGQILRDDGTPPAALKFFRMNDSMLMGRAERYEEPVRFDAQTGRFVFITQVFAAYSMEEHPPEPGPYQTGSSLIRIESDGCTPLTVQFYDEMPEVRIKLTTAEKPAS